MLIATLPPLYREELLKRILAHPLVGAVRYNTGMVSPYSPAETLDRLMALADVYGKKFWVDLKGRQLRIVHWAVPDYGRIILNHAVDVEGPARVYFRGAEFSDLKSAFGNVIFVDPPPASAVGDGQAINIVGESVRVRDYLTIEDREYLQAAARLGLVDFMLSFVESWSDIQSAELEYGKALGSDSKFKPNFHLKIESPKGFDFISSMEDHELKRYSLIAARDDWFVTVGEDKPRLLAMLERLVALDPEAIVASRLFSGLEDKGTVTLADYSDLELMHRFGYRHFMLSDRICHRHFDEAMAAWSAYQKTLTS